MTDYRPIFVVIGLMLMVTAVAMILPAAVDALSGNGHWPVFIISASITLFVGVTMTLTSRTTWARLSTRQAFLMTAFGWLTVTLFAALPFMYSSLNLNFTDAIFEAASGITTTGATVLTGLDAAPRGILLWRALLQWIGGIGILITAIAVFPVLRVGGMQLFRMESSEQSDKARPRMTQVIVAVGVIYLALTALCAGAYWLAGMSGFEAVATAMTTISTAGFSTSDASLGHFNNVAIEVVAIAGMLAGSLPFILYLKALQGNVHVLLRDSQVQWFFSIVALTVVAAAGWLWYVKGIEPTQALRFATFNVVSVMTGTGFATADYSLWGTFAVPVFFFIMFIGGCAGSTTCGIKIFRFQVLYAATRTQINHLLQPFGVFIPYYNRRPIPDEVIVSVLSFLFVFGLSFALLAIGLGMVGLDFMSAVSSAAAAISNVGPALGPMVGPASTFKALPDPGKWLMVAGMLLGRLELFPVMVLFTRGFWQG